MTSYFFIDVYFENQVSRKGKEDRGLGKAQSVTS